MWWKRRLRATSPFRFPIAAPARVAVLEAGFTLDRNAREFGASDFVTLEAWAPEAIVAPLRAALSLADRRLRGLMDLPSLNAAMVVLTNVDGEALEDSHRELLWMAFGVPIFEQLRSRAGAVVARECEVHDGLHVDPEARVTHELSTLSAAMMISEPCECGSETPRLLHLSKTLPNAPGTWNVVAPVGRQAM